MKLLSLIAVGLVIALSVGAQVTTDEKQQASPAQQEKPRLKKTLGPMRGARPPKTSSRKSERARTSAQETATTRGGVKVDEKVGAKQREGTPGSGKKRECVTQHDCVSKWTRDQRAAQLASKHS